MDVNGTNYSFDTPHDVEDLINQLTNEQDQLALWQQRATDSQNRITDLEEQIQSLCVTPV